MKYYWCALLAFAAFPMRTAVAQRATYHIETVAGSARIGDNGAATAAQFSNINGITVDRVGNVYISDTDHHRVRRVSTAGVVTTIAGTGSPGFTGDNGPAANAQLRAPYGLALDSSGNLYIADYGNQRIRRIGTDGIISTVAGNGRNASSPDGLPPLETSLLSPRNVAVDVKGNLFISEFQGHRVRRLSSDGKLVTVAGIGIAGWSGDGYAAAKAQINFPAGLAFDRAGALYIADSRNNLIRKVYADGTIGTVLGNRPETKLFTPLAVAVDSAGTIFAADSTRCVYSYTVNTKWTQYAGTGGDIFLGDGGPASSASFISVNDIALDVNGSLYIADSVRVRRVGPDANIGTMAGDGFLHAVGDGDSALDALLHQPSAIALDSAGNMYIADTGTQRVRQVTAKGIMITAAGTGVASHYAADGTAAVNSPLNSPMGVAIAPSGSITIADAYNHRIGEITLARAIRTVAGIGSGGTSSDGMPALLAALRGPKGVCFDRAGVLYIADTSNHRILRFTSNNTLQTIAGNGSGGYSGDTGAAQFAQLNMPGACAFDSAGNLYIADTNNHAIRKVAPSGTITTVAGNGAAGPGGDEGPATDANLASPRGLTVDDNGNVFIGDTGNNRVRVVDAAGVIHTIAGTGAAGFKGDTGPGASALLDGPAGLFLDGAGDLYFADSNNDRIRRLTPDVVAPPPVIQIPEVTVVNALSVQLGPVAPGEVVSIFGTGLGPAAGVTAAFDSNGALPIVLGGVEVDFDSTPAPIFFAQNGQLNVQVPYTVARAETATVTVSYKGSAVGIARVQIAPAAPGLLANALNQDGGLNSESEPAARTTWMTFYATGEGLTDGPNAAGAATAAPYPHPLLPIVLKIAGVEAEILYAGGAPGMVGMMQINARVPGGFVAPGKTQVELTVGSVSAAPIAIWLK